MPAPALLARGIERGFGATKVLRGVDLTVAPAERVAIIGPNGSGEATPPPLPAGLVAPPPGPPPPPPGPGRRGGFPPREPFLYGRLTALENLRFWAGLYGLRGVEDRARAL